MRKKLANAILVAWALVIIGMIIAFGRGAILSTADLLAAVGL